MCELIFEKCLTINPSILLSTKPKDQLNALHRAVANGHLSVCKLFITKLKNKNPRNKFEGSPLDMAATSGQFEICKLIIENIKIKNPKGVNKETPLHHAAKRGHLDICKLIIQNTKDKNPKDKMNETPLHHAAKNGHFFVCELIITQKQVKEKNPIDNSGWTPLRYASKHGFSSICKLIIKAGGRSENLLGGSISQIMNPSIAPSEILNSEVPQLVGDLSESGSGELPTLTLQSSPDDADPDDVENVLYQGISGEVIALRLRWS